MTVNWAILPVRDGETLQADWEGYLEAFETYTGLEAELTVVESYDAMVEGFHESRFDVAPMSHLLALNLVNEGLGEVFASQVLSAGEERSVLVARRDREISIDAVDRCDRTLRFAGGPERSVSQTLMPAREFFAPRSTTPQQCFLAALELNHGDVVAQIDDGLIDIGFTNSTNLAQLSETNPDLYGRLQTLWVSSPLPRSPIVWRVGLDTDAREKILMFLMLYGRSGGELEVDRALTVLEAINWRPPTPSSNEELAAAGFALGMSPPP